MIPQGTNLERVADCLERLNASYGVGSLGNVMLYLDGRIEFTQRPYGMREQRRKGRLVNGTVYALGHQKRIVA